MPVVLLIVWETVENKDIKREIIIWNKRNRVGNEITVYLLSCMR